MRDGFDVYRDNSQQVTSSLERQFDKSASLNDRTAGCAGASYERSFGQEALDYDKPVAQVSHASRAQSARQEARL